VKKTLAILLVMLLLVGCFSGCGNTGSKTTPAPQNNQGATNTTAAPGETGTPEAEDVPVVQIAGFYNLSGSSADTGVMAQQGVEMAVEWVNNNGGIKSLGGAKIEVKFYDTMSDPTQAKAVADRALADENILASIGIGGSAYGIPMLPSMEKAQCALILNGTSDNFTNQGYQCIDRYANDGKMFGETQVGFLQWLNESVGLGATKVGALYENTENGITNASGAKNAAEAAGLEWAYDETFQTGLSDASNIVVNMKQSGVEVVFLTAWSQDCKLLLNAMESLNYKPILIGSGASFLFPAFRDELAETVEGILSVQTAPWDSQAAPAELQALALEYEARYGDYMAEHAVGAFTAVQIAAAAIEKAGVRDRAAIMAACREVDDETFVGKINFDSTGQNVNIETAVIQWQKDEDGEFRPRCVYPDSIKAVDFLVTDQMREMFGVE